MNNFWKGMFVAFIVLTILTATTLFCLSQGTPSPDLGLMWDDPVGFTDWVTTPK